MLARTKAVIGVLLAASLFASVVVRAADEAGSLVIRDVTVVSAQRPTPLLHANVKIVDGVIAAVTTDALDGARVIDASGGYLVPGLIDSHVHLGGVTGMLPAHEKQNPGIAAAAHAQLPRSFLYYGFTTVIDLIGSPQGMTDWNGAELRPDAHFCGGAPVANGYPMVFAPEEYRFSGSPYFLYDERQKDSIPDSIDPAAHAPEAVVNRMADDGAICVKTFFERGFGRLHDLPVPTLEMMKALIAAARERGLPVLMHANSKEAQEFALDAGVDIIAHGLWNGVNADTPPAEIEQLLQRVADQQTGYQPTFQVLHGEFDMFETGFLDNPELANAYPTALIDWYRGNDGQWFANELAKGFDGDDPAPIYTRMLGRLAGYVKTLDEHNARLLFGSDTPSGPTYANPPGLNELREIRDWAAAGVSNATLFRALTLDNAKAFGLDDRIGSVQPGAARRAVAAARESAGDARCL